MHGWHARMAAECRTSSLPANPLRTVTHARMPHPSVQLGHTAEHTRITRCTLQVEEPVVICGFGPAGQMLAALLDAPMASLDDQQDRAYIGFDLDPQRVKVCVLACVHMRVCVWGGDSVKRISMGLEHVNHPPLVCPTNQPRFPQAARRAGYNVVYGDGSRAAVLRAAGVVKPRIMVVCMAGHPQAAHRTVEALRASFPNVPLYALGSDIK